MKIPSLFLKVSAIIFFLSFFVPTVASATTNNLKDGTITGIVYDDALNQPIPYVTVLLLLQDGNTLTGAITDSQGMFTLQNIPNGSYTLSIQYIGYASVNQSVTIDDKKSKIDVGSVYLKEDTTELEGVEVIAEVSSIQQKVDRKVITIGKDLAAAGTASELMVGIPSVSVDPQSGAISLRGNENVRILVDGKLSNIPAAQLLKQLPSSAIKSIELITNPSAKYNPDGMSGIINIILHKNQMQGFNGSVSSNWSYEINHKLNNGLNLNYRTGKFNVYGSYFNNFSKNSNHGHIVRPNDASEQFFNFIDDRKSQIFKIGVDVYLDDKNTISFFTNFNPATNLNDGVSRALFENDASLNQTQNVFADGENNSDQYNFNYKHDFTKEGASLELEANHNTYYAENPTSFVYPFDVESNYKDTNITDRERTTINIDYVNPITEKAKLELGVEARLFNSIIQFSSTGESINSEGLLVPAPDTTFDYLRDIYSAYVTYGESFEHWTYQAGLRFEQVEVDALALEDSNISEFTNMYSELYPSFFVTYSPTEKYTYQISYSKRIDRPGIGQVNPIKEWSTPLVSSYGNKELLPQFTNSVEINLTKKLKKGTLTTGVFYRFISDEINRVVLVDRTDVESGRVIISHDNFDDTAAVGFEISSNYRPLPWWNLNGSFDFYSQTQKGIAERLSKPINEATSNDIVTDINKVDNVAFNARLYNSFTASKKLSFTAFMFYRGRNRNLQFDVRPMYFVNIGARLNILKDKGSLNVGFNDIFNTMRFRFEGRLPFEQVGAFHWESRTVQVGFNYRFGNSKYRAKSRRKRTNDEKSGGGGLF